MKVIQRYSDINFFSINELEALLREYPWFYYAREVLLCKLAMLGREYFLSGVRNSVTFIQERDNLFVKAEEIISGKSINEVESTVNALSIDDYKEENIAEAKQERIYYPGGDYFSREDIEAVSLAQSFPLINNIVSQSPNVIHEEDKDDNCECECYSETLAGIYEDQGYFDKAVEVYDKLSLLYPEKNAYFASLIKEIKLKNR